MNAILDRMLWLPKGPIVPILSHIRAELTVTPEVYQGKSESFCLMQQGEDWVGVPRAWGMQQKWILDRCGEIEDRTIRPYLNWPDFVGKYRAGQQESVARMLEVFEHENKRGGLLESKTGSGKTVMALAIASQLNTPTLVVVHKEDLADQWKALVRGGFKEGKFADPMFPGEVGHVQGDKWDYKGKHLVTAMAQTLYSRQGKEPAGFWNQFGLVIFDEGHRYPARTFEKVLAQSHARFRMAVSATWRRRDGLECIWHWHVGSLEHRTKGIHLVGQYAQIDWHTKVKDSMFVKWRRIQHAAYLTAIARNVPYNKWLVEQLIEGAKSGRQMLLCSHRTDQLSDIRNRILKLGTGLSVGYYAGKVDGRQIKKDELESTKKCQIILGTFAKMSEGTDIATLDTLILATPSADVEQVVGRIQRPQLGKRMLLVVDPVWQTPYNKRLAFKRLGVYSRLGFTPQPKE